MKAFRGVSNASARFRTTPQLSSRSLNELSKLSTTTISSRRIEREERFFFTEPKLKTREKTGTGHSHRDRDGRRDRGVRLRRNRRRDAAAAQAQAQYKPSQQNHRHYYGADTTKRTFRFLKLSTYNSNTPQTPMNLDVLFNVTSSLLSHNFVQSLVSVVESVPSSAVLGDAAKHIGNTFETIQESLVSISSPIHFEFSELQTTLLIVFLIIIGVNVLLIVFYWSKYGGVITDRFIRPSTLKEIEELKLSVAKLKLPFEHTPRL